MVPVGHDGHIVLPLIQGSRQLVACPPAAQDLLREDRACEKTGRSCLALGPESIQCSNAPPPTAWRPACTWPCRRASAWPAPPARARRSPPLRCCCWCCSCWCRRVVAATAWTCKTGDERGWSILVDSVSFGALRRPHDTTYPLPPSRTVLLRLASLVGPDTSRRSAIAAAMSWSACLTMWGFGSISAHSNEGCLVMCCFNLNEVGRLSRLK